MEILTLQKLVLFLSSLVIGYRIRECEDRIGGKK